MAYRINENYSYKQMYKDLHNFLTEMTSIDSPNYELSTGNGTIVGIGSTTTTNQTISIQCTDNTSPATFSVSSNELGDLGTATVGELFESSEVYFTITDGDVAWEVDDIVTIDIKAAVSRPWINCLVGEDGGQAEQVLGLTSKTALFGGILNAKGTFFRIAGPKEDTIGFRPYNSVDYLTSERNNPQFQLSSTFYNLSNLVSNYGINFNDIQQNTEAWSIQFWIKNPNYNKSSTYDQWQSTIMTPLIADSGTTLGITYGTNRISVSVFQTGNYSVYLSYQFNFYDLPDVDWTEWQLITVTIDLNEDPQNIYLYVNTTKVRSNRDDQIEAYQEDDREVPLIPYFNDVKPFLGGILGQADLSHFVLFDHVLSGDEISDIVNNQYGVDVEAPEVIDYSVAFEDNCMPIVDVINNSEYNTPVSVQFYPQHAPYYSYRIASEPKNRINHVVDFIALRLYNKKDYSPAFSDITDPAFHTNTYLLGDRPNRLNISKYWMIADENRIILAYKIYDSSSVQQLPIYQVGYAGISETINEKITQVSVGTYNSPNEYWTTTNDNFYSGFYNRNNVAWAIEWGIFKSTRVSSPNHANGYVITDSNLNVWKPFHVINKNKALYEVKNRWTYVDIYEKLGSFKGVYSIQPSGVAPEDELIMNGIRHVAVNDCTQSEQNSVLLLELKE